jgi:competence protein ComEC
VNAWRSPHLHAAAICVGIAAANLARLPRSAILLAAGVALLSVAIGDTPHRAPLLAAALALTGWWWGSARLDALDHSVLLPRVGTAERSQLVVTGPARVSPFELRLPAEVRRFGGLRFREPVLLELPLGRAPPQGALLEAITTVRLPRPPSHGFDERTWLRHQGVHVVLRADRWKLIGHRGGLWGVADRLRAALARSTARGLRGERRGVVEGVVLGDEQALSANLRDRFRASGLYHLLAVSGQNVALVAAGALVLAWLIGVPRWLGQLGALTAIGGYVLAVGPQPSVVRAGVVGALASLAWLAARPADRWYFLLLAGLVLLAWNPYDVLDAGFQLSFAAVVAIFLLVPRFAARLEGYPLPAKLGAALAVSTSCGLITAPILWLQFHAVPLMTVPANALAEPAVAPLLYLAFAAAAAALVFPPAATTVAWLNGWCAAYLAGCARFFGGLPGAQVRSGRGLLAVVALASLGAAYAWRRWQSSLRST